MDQLDYVALALRAEGRAEASDSSEIADCWRKLAETYWLMAGQPRQEEQAPVNASGKQEKRSSPRATPGGRMRSSLHHVRSQGT